MENFIEAASISQCYCYSEIEKYLEILSGQSWVVSCHSFHMQNNLAAKMGVAEIKVKSVRTSGTV